MKSQSPIVAMLWEQWRLTRAEAVTRLGIGTVAASAVLTLPGESATAAYFLLLLTHCMFWFSISKLNGGRVMDGYKPGFPLQLFYSRPVPTFVFVGVAMVYDAVSCTALYLVSAAFVGYAFGQPLPLFSVAIWLITFHFVSTAVQWSTTNRMIQWGGSFAICLPLFWMLRNHRVASPLRIEFSLAENTMMAILGVVAIGLTVAGVARQRSGGTATAPRTTGSTGYSDWLIALFRFPCPTSSAIRARLWFELKSSGLPVLTIGATIAIVVALLFAVGLFFAPARSFALVGAFLSVPVVLLFLGANAFGIRQKQGRTYLSAFEATQPHNSVQMAGPKMLVRTVCVFAALVAVGVSVWISSSLMSAWEAWPVESKNSLPALLKLRREIVEGFAGMTGFEYAALVFVVFAVIALLVASRAAFTALRARYSRRVNIVVSLMLLCGLAFVVLAWARQRGIVSEFLFSAIQSTANWIATAALIIATAYVCWRSLAERLLTPRRMLGLVLISAAFGLACTALVGISQSSPAGITTTKLLLPLTLAALMACVVAPWSLNRIRHL